MEEFDVCRKDLFYKKILRVRKWKKEECINYIKETNICDIDGKPCQQWTYIRGKENES